VRNCGARVWFLFVCTTKVFGRRRGCRVFIVARAPGCLVRHGLRRHSPRLGFRSDALGAWRSASVSEGAGWRASTAGFPSQLRRGSLGRPAKRGVRVGVFVCAASCFIRRLFFNAQPPLPPPQPSLVPFAFVVRSHCSFLVDLEVTAPALCALSVDILKEKGQLPVGEVGKLLQVCYHGDGGGGGKKEQLVQPWLRAQPLLLCFSRPLLRVGGRMSSICRMCLAVLLCLFAHLTRYPTPPTRTRPTFRALAPFVGFFVPWPWCRRLLGTRACRRS
jgi:hypothetical protein